jgi:nitronate monooxygenase
MGRVAGPELAAAVSRAGGLGILAGLNLPPADLDRQIARVRELTDRPFGVNLWLHPDVRDPIPPAQLPAENVASANAALAPFRAAVGLPGTAVSPPERPADVDAAIELVLERRVAFLSVALGLPAAVLVERCHAQGVRVMAMVTNVDDARSADAAGIDVIVAQGIEAGGHRSNWRPEAPAGVGTFALVPEVVDAVRAPVVAAGGIADGRGLAAAQALGAAGVLMGTRFVATRESTAPAFWKQAILDAAAGSTTITKALTGLPARVLRNRLVEEYEKSGAPVLPGLHQAALEQDIWLAAARAGRSDWFPMYAGQSVGIIRDLPGAGEVVASMVREADEALQRITSRSR